MVGPFRSFLSHAVKFYKVKQFLFETELVNFHYCLSCLLHVLTSRNNSLLIFFFWWSFVSESLRCESSMIKSALIC